MELPNEMIAAGWTIEKRERARGARAGMQDLVYVPPQLNVPDAWRGALAYSLGDARRRYEVSLLSGPARPLLPPGWTAVPSVRKGEGREHVRYKFKPPPSWGRARLAYSMVQAWARHDEQARDKAGTAVESDTIAQPPRDSCATECERFMHTVDGCAHQLSLELPWALQFVGAPLSPAKFVELRSRLPTAACEPGAIIMCHIKQDKRTEWHEYTSIMNGWLLILVVDRVITRDEYFADDLYLPPAHHRHNKLLAQAISRGSETILRISHVGLLSRCVRGAGGAPQGVQKATSFSSLRLELAHEIHMAYERRLPVATVADPAFDFDSWGVGPFLSWRDGRLSPT